MKNRECNKHESSDHPDFRKKLASLCDILMETSLFVFPSGGLDQTYRPFVGDALFTNFHQPQSTLLMLVSALSGYEMTRTAYEHALRCKYRFLSYGDASLFEFFQTASMVK